LIERVAVLGGEQACYKAVRSVSKLISDEFNPMANIGSLANRSIERADNLIVASTEYFGKIKLRNNQIAQEVLPVAKDFIQSGQTRKEKFERACHLTTASNVAPIGAPSGAFKFQEVENILRGKTPISEVSEELYETTQRAKHILYLADNAGEIGFDSLFIAKLKERGSKITLVVKEEPFFEDATKKDVSFFHLNGSVDRIFTLRGFFVPNEIPPALLDAFENSDVVISKGTGNYEGLESEAHGKPTIFLLKVKCKPIAKRTGVDVGSFTIKYEG
jgi:uncharacterized protein with ATP-grasp and redox domains